MFCASVTQGRTGSSDSWLIGNGIYIVWLTVGPNTGSFQMKTASEQCMDSTAYHNIVQ